MDDKDKSQESINNAEANESSEEHSIPVTVTKPSHEPKPEPASPVTEELNQEDLDDISKKMDAEEPAKEDTESQESEEKVAEEEPKSSQEAPVETKVVSESNETKTSETITKTESDKPKDEAKAKEQKPVITQSTTNYPPSEAIQLRKKLKSLKVWLVIFLFIIIGLISTGLVYYMDDAKSSNNTTSLEKENSDLKNKVASLEQEIAQQSNAKNSEQDSNSENQDQTDPSDDLQKQIDTLNKYIEELKKVCGTACEAVEMPTINNSAPSAPNNQ